MSILLTCGGAGGVGVAATSGTVLTAAAEGRAADVSIVEAVFNAAAAEGRVAGISALT